MPIGIRLEGCIPCFGGLREEYGRRQVVLGRSDGTSSGEPKERNMKKIELDELKRLQLDILIAVHNFCKENDIKYSLAYGTLIGAIRHKGYIPWDDDIDIMMPRNDYNRFIQSFNGTFKHLSVLAPELNLNYYAPYANVFDNRTLLKEGRNNHGKLIIGVKIDVFPMDYVSEIHDEYEKQILLSKKLNFALWVKRLSLGNLILKKPMQALKVLLWRLRYLFNTYATIQKRIIYNSRLCSQSSFVTNVVYPDIYERKCNKRILNEFENILFEGKEVTIIKEYDIYLKNIYGDYMQLPPVEKRVPLHNFEAYWID